MTFKDIIALCKKIDVYEDRKTSDDYCEFVFYTKDTLAMENIFRPLSNEGIKPFGSKPSKDDVRLTQNYGGIYANQALYKIKYNGSTVVAMFWPWGNGDYTTLKLAVIGK